MRYKILLYGKKPPMLADFIRRSGAVFSCLTTSDIWEDVDAHIDVFKPDALMIFSDQPDEAMAEMADLVREEHRLPIIVTGDEDSILEFERKAPEVSALKIKRPTTIQEMQTRINEYIGQKKVSVPTEAKSPEAVGAQLAGNAVSDLLKSFEMLEAKKHILVVDDDRTVLKMLKTALSDDYEITTIAGGKAAEKFLEQRTADLILLDYEMPDESGPDVFKAIKGNPRASDIPVIFLTGVADVNKIKEVLALGPRGYLLKPIDMNRLKATITEILG